MPKYKGFLKYVLTFIQWWFLNISGFQNTEFTDMCHSKDIMPKSVGFLKYVLTFIVWWFLNISGFQGRIQFCSPFHWKFCHKLEISLKVMNTPSWCLTIYICMRNSRGHNSFKNNSSATRTTRFSINHS